MRGLLKNILKYLPVPYWIFIILYGHYFYLKEFKLTYETLLTAKIYPLVLVALTIIILFVYNIVSLIRTRHKSDNVSVSKGLFTREYVISELKIILKCFLASEGLFWICALVMNKYYFYIVLGLVIVYTLRSEQLKSINIHNKQKGDS